MIGAKRILGVSSPATPPRPSQGKVTMSKRTIPAPLLILLLTCALTYRLAGCGTAPNAQQTVLEDDPAAAALVFPDDADPATAALPFVDNELLVQPYPGASGRELGALYAHVGATIAGAVGEIQLTVLNISPDRLEAAASELAASGLVEAVHRNYIYAATATPNDPLFPMQDHLPQVHAPEAWDVTVGDENIIIAIVDTGVAAEHPDLIDKIIDGWNVVDASTDFADGVGHGTQAAGIAAASSGNATGVAGLSWASPILPVRVTDNAGRTSGGDLAAGILWAVNHGAKVINVSFAPLWSNSVVRSAAEHAFNRGSLVVISAGNAGGARSVPGYLQALFVGAVNGNNEIASFSDRGPFVDLVAPGTGIRSTGRNASYQLASGTSFAAPIVAGVAALAWSVNPNLRPVTIVEAILDSAIDLGALGTDSTYGHGRVDAAGAVNEALQAVFSLDVEPPEVRIRRPTDGASRSGRFLTTATVTDDWGVADVVLSIDGIPVGTDTRVPYWFVVDTADYSGGTHTLALVATDLAGNASELQSVRVTFTDSPRTASADSSVDVVFVSPADGARVVGNVTVKATVAAENGLATVEWFVDGASVVISSLSGRSSGIIYVWRSAEFAVGRHAITLVVTDADGNQSTGRLDLVR